RSATHKWYLHGSCVSVAIGGRAEELDSTVRTLHDIPVGDEPVDQHGGRARRTEPHARGQLAHRGCAPVMDHVVPNAAKRFSDAVVRHTQAYELYAKLRQPSNAAAAAALDRGPQPLAARSGLLRPSFQPSFQRVTYLPMPAFFIGGWR